MNRKYLILLAGSALLLPLRVSGAADSAVDLKNEGSMAVSVPIGTDNGVTLESDFEVVTADNTAVPVYPLELYGDRFWSQPLSPEEFSRIRPGMAVRPSTLPGPERARARAEGEKRLESLRAGRERARREAARGAIDGLRKKKAELEDERDAVEDRIAAAEKDLADEEERTDRLVDSGDRDIDLALQRILDLSDRRDEFQERRLALSGERPVSREEIGRLTAEIERLNDRIDSERARILTARDRKRSARSAYLARRKEWKELVAERNRLDAAIEAADRKIRDLVDSLR